MKRTAIILAAALAALATGCARPAYTVKSDAVEAYMHGRVRQLRQTLYDNPARADSLPGTLGEHDTYIVVDYNRAGNITREEAFRGPATR